MGVNYKPALRAGGVQNRVKDLSKMVDLLKTDFEGQIFRLQRSALQAQQGFFTRIVQLSEGYALKIDALTMDRLSLSLGKLGFSNDDLNGMSVWVETMRGSFEHLFSSTIGIAEEAYTEGERVFSSLQHGLETSLLNTARSVGMGVTKVSNSILSMFDGSFHKKLGNIATQAIDFLAPGLGTGVSSLYNKLKETFNFKSISELFNLSKLKEIFSLNSLKKAIGFTKEEFTSKKGLLLGRDATSSGVNLSSFTTERVLKKDWWGVGFLSSLFGSKDRVTEKTTYGDPSDVSQAFKIRQSLLKYDDLLSNLGVEAKRVSIKAGEYGSYADVANAGARDFISKLLGSDVEGVYKVWEDHSKAVGKSLDELLHGALSTYSESTDKFKMWRLKSKGDELGLAKYEKELADRELGRLKKLLGAYDVNIDNFLEYKDRALKESFDPEVLSNINALGDALMKNSDASSKYRRELECLSSKQGEFMDPFLEQTRKLDDINARQGNDSDRQDTHEKLLLQIASSLNRQTRLQQEMLDTRDAT